MNSESPPGLVDRLRLASESAGGPTELSAKTGIPLRTLNNYLGGVSEPKAGAVLKIALASGKSAGWLLTGDQTQAGPVVIPEPSDDAQPRAVSAEQLGDDYVLLPRYDVRAAAGAGAVVHSEQIVDWLAFKAEWVRRKLGLNLRDLFLLEALGDSMVPTIYDGDLILVNGGITKVKDNSIYVLGVDGELSVKRIQRQLDGTLIVMSDNDRYKPETVPADRAASLRIIGHVVWSGGLIR